jgi:hypothetical protein
VRNPVFPGFDISLERRVRFVEQRRFNLRAEFLNAFNCFNFGGATCASNSLSCGQVTSARTDASNRQDPGGRLIQIVRRINF